MRFGSAAAWATAPAASSKPPLAALGVEARGGVSVAAVTPQGTVLAGGEVMPAATVVRCAGMRANALTETPPFRRDRLGRIAVDEFRAVEGQSSVFAAGDCADACGGRGAALRQASCQHARPMGRLAGHNVVSASVLGEPMLEVRCADRAGARTTILDLGAWGAVYTEGWDRQGRCRWRDVAKRTKMLINRQRIYPPRSGERAEILAAAAPAIQTPPAKFAGG